MVSAISNVAQAHPVAQSTGTSSQKPNPSKSQSATKMDSVQLSSAAQSMLAALQEATEAPAQTAKEAGGGDRQAQMLLAKEVAAKSLAQ